MIDFRYHLVSIVAIFLALAVGIVMGTTLLSSPAIESALQNAQDLRKSNNDYREQLGALQAREERNDAFVSAEMPAIIRGQLTGERVLLVAAPGSSGTLREQAEQVLVEAGATISGQVTLTEKYVEPAQANFVDQLSISLATGVTLPGTDPHKNAAALLAATLLTTDDTQAGTENTATRGVLEGFVEANLLTIDGTPAKRATLALVVAPDGLFTGEKAQEQTSALVTLAAGLDAGAQGAVLAGTMTSTQPGGLIAALRGTSDAAAKVSSVDTLDMPAGRAVVVFALREQLGGRSGQYGLGADAAEFQPASSAATPAPSTSGS
ncbi:copper transporter [Nonomuraea sp. NPDC049152]|uniref:copper transporter n=1 Tax=Nonomuraea sp. NPDC049152 TaxID=3154350 RepID=UPI0033ECB467